MLVFRILFFVLCVHISLHASRPALTQKGTTESNACSSSSSSSRSGTSTLQREALMPLIDDANGSTLPIDLWEKIILPYVGIDGGLKTLYNSPHAYFTDCKGDNNNIRFAHFNHDGTQIVTANHDKTTVRIWNSDTGALLRTLKGHERVVTSADFNCDGTQIISTSLDNTVRIWNNDNGKLLQTLAGHTGGALSAEFNHDGAQIVSGGHDHTARIWNSKTGALLQTLTGHKCFVGLTLFNNDSTRIITQSSDGTYRIWDSNNGNLLSRFKGCSPLVALRGFNKDKQVDCCVRSDDTLHIWDNNTGAILRILKLPTHGGIFSAEINNDGTRIVTINFDQPSAQILHLPTTKPTLNQMILLWALDQQIKKEPAKKIILNLVAQEHNISPALIHKIFKSFSLPDQHNIAKIFNIDFPQAHDQTKCIIQ